MHQIKVHPQPQVPYHCDTSLPKYLLYLKLESRDSCTSLTTGGIYHEHKAKTTPTSSK